jgi:flavin-dependent dehydrogenase
MVGDASGLVRAFKGKGVTTAVLTGIRAAETIMHFGISKDAFHHHYQDENQDIISDLPYGKVMRLAAIYLSRFGLMEIVLRAAKNSPLLQDALFNAVSAHGPYKQVIQRALKPESIQAISQAIFQKQRVVGD